MKCRAYAKVNLGLDVVSKREDGYHELKSVMVPIQLHDLIDINVHHEMRFECVPNFLIHPEKNTLLKMIEVCREKYQFTENFAIRLFKHIPSQAGLGGGSSDAAAVLNYLDYTFKWNLTPQEKIDLAVQVGADVPFCLFEKPALVTGIGEKLEFFENHTSFWMVLVQPRKGVSTKKAFEGLDIPNLVHPNIDRIKESLMNNKYNQFIDSIDNSLEKKAISLVPEIKRLKELLIDLGCDRSMMTGSGSVVMGFSQSEVVIDHCIKTLRKQARFVRKTKIL